MSCLSLRILIYDRICQQGTRWILQKSYVLPTLHKFMNRIFQQLVWRSVIICILCKRSLYLQWIAPLFKYQCRYLLIISIYIFSAWSQDQFLIVWSIQLCIWSNRAAFYDQGMVRVMKFYFGDCSLVMS